VTRVRYLDVKDSADELLDNIVSRYS
jgi:hypothetical protein